uniref:Uncharacterized protein n=1 Tax=Anguilla anguilla TaxID=7936 RepID=A0A0E9QT17_ANGAN
MIMKNMVTGRHWLTWPDKHLLLVLTQSFNIMHPQSHLEHNKSPTLQAAPLYFKICRNNCSCSLCNTLFSR